MQGLTEMQRKQRGSQEQESWEPTRVLPHVHKQGHHHCVCCSNAKWQSLTWFPNPETD